VSSVFYLEMVYAISTDYRKRMQASVTIKWTCNKYTSFKVFALV